MLQKNNDEIRELILQFLYDKYKKARSVGGAGVIISRMKTALKKQGLKEQEIASNLYYLIQIEWVVEHLEKYPLKQGNRTITATKKLYAITDKGINHFEGPSKFQKIHKFTGINITNIQGVTVIGDNTIVNSQYVTLYQNLDLLGEEIRKSDSFSDEQKLNYQAEIETIKSQLEKPKPDRGIIKTAWNVLSAAGTLMGGISAFERVAELIASLL